MYGANTGKFRAMGANKTSFKKGYDAKRYVRTNEGLMTFYKELNELLRTQSLEAFTFLVETMNNPKASLKLRATVAMDILNRGIGKPVDVTVIATLDRGTDQTADKITTNELEQIVSKLNDKPVVIEGEFKDIN